MPYSFFASSGRFFAKAVIYHQEGLYELAIEAYRDALSRRSVLTKKDIIRIYEGMAESFLAMKCFQDAKDCYTQVSRFQKEVFSYHSLEVVLTLRQLAAISVAEQHFTEAMQAYRQALGVLSQLPVVARTLRQKLEIYQSMGELEHTQGRYVSAIFYFKKAQLSASPGTDEAWAVLRKIGIAYLVEGALKQAGAAFGAALEIQKRREPLNPINLAVAYDDFGSYHEQLHQMEEAAICFRAALELRQVHMPNTIDLAMSHYHCGSYYATQLNYAIAQEHFQAAEILLECVPVGVQTGLLYQKIAEFCLQILSKEKQHLPAEEYAELIQRGVCYGLRSITVLEEAMPSTLCLDRSYLLLTQLYQLREEWHEAFTYAQLSLRIKEQLQPETLPLAKHYQTMALLQRYRHHLQSAHDFLQQALGIFQKQLQVNETPALLMPVQKIRQQIQEVQSQLANTPPPIKLPPLRLPKRAVQAVADSYKEPITRRASSR